VTILERWQNDEQWRNTMTENGYDRDSIVGMDAMNAAPKASREEIETNAWNKEYREEKFRGFKQIRRTDKDGGAGTVARWEEPDYDEVLAKRPRNTPQDDARGDSGAASSSTWNQRNDGQASWWNPRHDSSTELSQEHSRKDRSSGSKASYNWGR
jgi:hypothetical protein